MCAYEISNSINWNEYLKPLNELPKIERTVKRIIYVIQNYDGIQAIFSDKAAAEEYAKRTGTDDGCEFEIDPPLPPLIDGDKYAFVVGILCRDGSMKFCRHCSMESVKDPPNLRTWLDTDLSVKSHCFIAVVAAKTEGDAIEAAMLQFVTAGALGHVNEIPKNSRLIEITKEMLTTDGMAK